MQDADSPLRVDACFKLESGKVCLVEPLDYLLLCVSWILLLQPHGKSDHPSEFSWPCFDFSLSQENEVRDARLTLLSMDTSEVVTVKLAATIFS